MARVVSKIDGLFTPVRDEIRDRPGLSLLAVCIYSDMERRVYQQGSSRWWTIGSRLLAPMWKSSKWQVQRAIMELETAKLIEVKRGGRGHRASYRLLQDQNKVAGIQPLVAGIQPLVAGIQPLVAGGRPRKRERPIETKKNPPTPQGGRESSALSRNGEEKKDQQAVAESDGRSEARRAALALFYPSGVPDTQPRQVNRQLNALGKLCDEPEQVEIRHGRWSTVFPNAGACTLRSLVKHWDALAPPPPNPYDPWGGRPPTKPPRDED